MFLVSCFLFKMAGNTLKFLVLKRPRVSQVIAKLGRYTTTIADAFRQKRKRRRYMMFLTVAAVLACSFPVDRQLWMLPRSDHWFAMAETTFSEEEWYGNFRVSKDTFQYIVLEIEQEIARKDTKMRKSISSKKRVAITLYYMGSTAEYRTIANLFGVSTAFVCLCIKEVSKAITKKLKVNFLFVPKGQDLREVMMLYKDKWGFPLCAGAIDGTHIPIRAPPENHTDYVNRKSYHSIVMQAVVDSRYLFRDVVIGWPGSVHDARVLSNSELYNRGVQGQLFDLTIKETVLDVEIGPVIPGDPAYPLLNWLMKAYPENQNTPNWQRHFNYRLSRARMSGKDVFKDFSSVWTWQLTLPVTLWQLHA